MSNENTSIYEEQVLPYSTQQHMLLTTCVIEAGPLDKIVHVPSGYSMSNVFQSDSQSEMRSTPV